jgi:hypothetical protein
MSLIVNVLELVGGFLFTFVLFYYVLPYWSAATRMWGPYTQQSRLLRALFFATLTTIGHTVSLIATGRAY